MVWLIAEMWGLLFIAFGIGLATGWWAARSTANSDDKKTETPLGTLNVDSGGDSRKAADDEAARL